MTDIVSTEKNVALLIPQRSETYSGVAGEALTAGDAVCFNTAGNVVKADASAQATAQVAGVVTASANSGDAVSIVKNGPMTGYTVSGLANKAKLYLSDTAGKLADAPGTWVCLVGSVFPLTDPSRTKVTMIECDWSYIPVEVA